MQDASIRTVLGLDFKEMGNRNITEAGKLALNPEDSQRPIFLLHLGTKANILFDSGIRTIGELSERMLSDGHSLARLSGIGEATIQLTRRRLAAVDKAQRADGFVDWDDFAVKAGLVLTPSSAVGSGAAFLSALPEVYEHIKETRGNELSRRVLSDRLLVGDRRSSTMEEIGDQSASPVTRERVRQLQRGLQKELSNALLDDTYGANPLHFRTSFVEYWKLIRRELVKGAANTSLKFIGLGLAELLSVKYGDLEPHMPFIALVIFSDRSRQTILWEIFGDQA
ncbi:hypothetical protein [Mesorhizobium sp. M0239]|uniref:hypothetical protein n=1 Tax=Mesorhizobium sp. M0239 TaxID=2956924 RepID=UPI00333A0DC9